MQPVKEAKVQDFAILFLVLSWLHQGNHLCLLMFQIKEVVNQFIFCSIFAYCLSSLDPCILVCPRLSDNRDGAQVKSTRPLPSFPPFYFRVRASLLGSLSSNVFERRTSTGSEVFSLLTCLDDIKFIFLSFFTVIEAI